MGGGFILDRVSMVAGRGYCIRKSRGRGARGAGGEKTRKVKIY